MQTNNKLREALKQIYDYAWAHGVWEIEAMAKTALAEQPRNCDVGTVKDQTSRFDAFCERNMQHYKDMFGDGLNGWDCKADCPIGRMIDCDHAVADRCQLAWAQMPYENEGVE